MSVMEIMDPSGHSKHIWDSESKDETKAARKLYDELTGKGYRAFHVKKGGEEGKRMDSFDPDAEKMIMVPPLRGG